MKLCLGQSSLALEINGVVTSTSPICRVAINKTFFGFNFEDIGIAVISFNPVLLPWPEFFRERDAHSRPHGIDH